MESRFCPVTRTIPIFLKGFTVLHGFAFFLLMCSTSIQISLGLSTTNVGDPLAQEALCHPLDPRRLQISRRGRESHVHLAERTGLPVVAMASTALRRGESFVVKVKEPLGGKTGSLLMFMSSMVKIQAAHHNFAAKKAHSVTSNYSTLFRSFCFLLSICFDYYPNTYNTNKG